jgi:outer membrane protein TolC
MSLLNRTRRLAAPVSIASAQRLARGPGADFAAAQFPANPPPIPSQGAGLAPLIGSAGRLQGFVLSILLATATAVPAQEYAATGNPALDGLIAEALRNNPEIQAAGHERDAAHQRIAPAGALDDPMLEAGIVNLPTSFQFDQDSMTMKMVGLAQRYPYPGKRGLRRNIAAQEAEAADHGYQETVNGVIKDVKTAYYELAFAVESTELVQGNIDILEQFLKTAEARHAVGDAQQADVLKAQTQLARMQDELIRLGREQATLEAELNRALGREPAADLPQPGFPRLKEVTLSLDAFQEAALQSRPRLLALQQLIEGSAEAVRLAKLDYYPDFDVRLSFGQRDTLEGGMPQDDMVSLTVGVNLPIWRETKRAPRVAEAVAMHDRALSMYRTDVNEISARLRQEVSNARQSLQSARLYETAILPQARLTVESALAAYKVNRVDFFTLLDNQMVVFDSEIAHAFAVTNYYKSLAEIEAAVGKPMF